MSRTRRGLGARIGCAAGVLLLGPVVAVGGIAGAVVVGITQLPSEATPSADARADIPPTLLVLYRQATERCPGLPWSVLAGIGKVESNHNRPPDQVSSDGAQGPMQFLPGTWTAYGTDANGDGRADPMDPADAIGAAADYLCAHRATRDLTGAVASYSCVAEPRCLMQATGPDGYALRALAWAARYSTPTSDTDPLALVAVQTALAQVGTPYQWGGASPQVGFDCSGLVQYAYAQAGVDLPRTAQSQYDHGPQLPAGTDPQPGDLVFFGTSPTHVTHVGIALGQQRMLDAPHTGALVRVEPIAGLGHGDEHYLGATRPAAAAGPP